MVGKISLNIPDEDAEILMQLYESTPHRGVHDLSPADFVRYVGCAIHSKYIRDVINCINVGKGNNGNQNYTGFINQETYFQGRREEQGKPHEEVLSIWSKEGQERRRRLTLQRLVRAGIDYYLKVGNNVSSSDRDLRCDLSHWD